MEKIILDDIKNILLKNIANRLNSYGMGSNFDKEYLASFIKRMRMHCFLQLMKHLMVLLEMFLKEVY